MSPAMGRRMTAYCSIQASRTRDREKFTVVPSSSWDPYLSFEGPESVGQSISCLRHVLLCIELGLRMASPSLEEWLRSLIIASARLDGIK